MHPDPRAIGELAYRLWQARGCPDGTAEQNWLDAETQLKAVEPDRPAVPDARPTVRKGPDRARALKAKSAQAEPSSGSVS
jgi:Protein of unknown function (DUF2934)